jgi:osmoprotectant transport system permease protein
VDPGGAGSLVAAVEPSRVSAQSCLAANSWICGEYLQTRSSEILSALGEHLLLTVVSLLVGVALAFPLALLARTSPTAQGFVLGSSTAVYTIPSLALFAVLLPITGITQLTVLVGLVLYSLTILVRAFVDGLTSVPDDVIDAAEGMGYGPAGLLWRVRLPLSLPTFFAGLRVATVSTVALVTVGFVVGHGGLGNLINHGLNTFFRSEVLTATVLCVVLAVAADLVVVGAERLAVPWRRRG